MKKRLVVVYKNLGHYHLPRLIALAKVCPRMLVIELSSKHSAYGWCISKQGLPFELRTLFNKPSDIIPKVVQKNSLISCLSKYKTDVIILSGYKQPMWSIANWAKKQNVATVLLFSTTWCDHKRLWFKEYIKSKFIISRFSCVAATGKRAFDYAQKLRMPENRIFRIGNVVDNAYFLSRSRTILKNEKSDRKQLNLSRRYFLVVSRLAAEKNYHRLLEAFNRYRKQGGTWDLVIVGSGPQAEALVDITNSSAISGVHFKGWQDYEDLPTYYTLASCFILPSLSESWGLTVNEAMACGLPVLVSRRCGCLPELCKSGVNGYDFDPYDTEEITRLMFRMSDGDEDLRPMGEAGRRIISDFTPQSWAESLKQCILTALKHS